MDAEIAKLFLGYSESKLRQMREYVEACLGRLTEEQVWGRGGAHENAIGNLILHLCGNVRQWIVAGVGGAQDVRDREQEFAAQGGRGIRELTALLRETVADASRVLGTVTPQRLTEVIRPQHGPVTVLEAIYQVVGHFQQHTGQIIYATKIYAGEDLGLYKP